VQKAGPAPLPPEQGATLLATSVLYATFASQRLAIRLR